MSDGDGGISCSMHVLAFTAEVSVAALGFGYRY